MAAALMNEHYEHLPGYATAGGGTAATQLVPSLPSMALHTTRLDTVASTWSSSAPFFLSPSLFSDTVAIRRTNGRNFRPIGSSSSARVARFLSTFYK